MNFQTYDPQLYNVIQKPVKGMQYNVSESYPDVRRNKYIPPLLQARPVIRTTNSAQFVTKSHVEPKFKQSDSASHQNTSVYNRSRAASEVSLYQQTIPQAFNQMEPSTSAESCLGNRKNGNISYRVSEMSAQGNADPIPRHSVTSAASSVTDFNIGGNNNTVPTYESAVRNNYRIFGSTESEKMFIFTGTVEKVIKWNKIFRNHFCYYEVIASVISIQQGSVNTQRIMLLRDKKGPILQVVYYNNIHIDIEDFHAEQVLRCLGRMGGPNILNAVSIRSASQEEVGTLQRLSLACDKAISHFLSV